METIFFVAVIALFLFGGAFLLWAKNKRREKEKREAEVEAMIDRMSIRRASINTQYLEKGFFKTIEMLVLSLYSLDPQFIPAQKMTPEFYQEWYSNLKREYELGIRKLVCNFIMENAKVVKQENSSMYAVTHIEVEAQFFVDYDYYHCTMREKVRKRFKQRFVFMNNNEGWFLEKALPENVIKKEEIPITTTR